MRDKTEIYAHKVGSHGWEVQSPTHGGLHLCGVSRLLRKISTLIDDKDAVVSVFVQVKRKK